MLYAKKVSVGKFIKKDTLKDGDLLVIASEGKKVEGQFGEQDVFLVKVNGEEGNMSFNQKSINNLIDAFGADSLKWIGKQVKVWKVRAMVSGKLQWIVYVSHPKALMTDDGEFVLEGALPKSEEESLEEITGEDVNF